MDNTTGLENASASSKADLIAKLQALLSGERSGQQIQFRIPPAVVWNVAFLLSIDHARETITVRLTNSKRDTVVPVDIGANELFE